MPEISSVIAPSGQVELAQLAQAWGRAEVVYGLEKLVLKDAAGLELADGLAEFPQAFPELYRATVAAGEQSGHLDVVLERLADYTEARQELRQRVTNALIYPIALVVFAVGIIAFMLATVVPKIVNVFENTAADLPALTTAMIASSDFLRDYWLLLILGVGGLLWLARWVIVGRPAIGLCCLLALRLPVLCIAARGRGRIPALRATGFRCGIGRPGGAGGNTEHGGGNKGDERR